jgi:hypothetical protein
MPLVLLLFWLEPRSFLAGVNAAMGRPPVSAYFAILEQWSFPMFVSFSFPTYVSFSFFILFLIHILHYFLFISYVYLIFT